MKQIIQTNKNISLFVQGEMGVKKIASWNLPGRFHGGLPKEVVLKLTLKSPWKARSFSDVRKFILHWEINRAKESRYKLGLKFLL
jgi:hypothetical protein